MSLLLQYKATIDDARYDVFNSSSAIQDHFPSIVISHSTTLYKNRNTCDLQHESKIAKHSYTDYQPFLVVQQRDGEFFVANVHKSSDSDSSKEMLCMLVSNDYENQSVLPLKEGRILKLGMVQLKLESLVLSAEKNRKSKTFYEEKVFSQIAPHYKIGVDFYEDSTYASTIDSAPVCRYCFSKSLDKDNEFLSLCKCEGSSKYVHSKCLSAWVVQRSRYYEPKPGIFMADRKGLACEICKCLFPIKEVLPCFSEQVLKQYAILSASTQKHQTIYIIKLGQSCSLSVGRKAECDISVEDPSVSRNHCILNWDSQKGQLSVRDDNSKFGTLVKKSSLAIRSECVLQRGRVRLVLTPISRKSAMKRTIKGLFSFLKSEKI